MTSRVRVISALGSSFASGAGIPPIADRWARRSARNYPAVVAAELGARLVDLSSAGATTDDLLVHRQRRILRSRAPQVSGIDPQSDLVLITAGGNDIGYVQEITRLVRESRHHRKVAMVSPEFDSRVRDAATWLRLRRQLVAVADRSRARSPGARVFFVDYLRVAGDGGSPDLVDHPASARFVEVGALLSNTLEEAARDTSATFVPAPLGPPGSAWVTGFGADAPFHPTAEGMAALAGAVLTSLHATGDRPKRRPR